MAVFCTDDLRAVLSESNLSADLLIQEFGNWKAGWPANEYAFRLFGKDGAYRTPPVDGIRGVLRHVHLQPVQDEEAERTWLRRFRFRSRKTSDRALIYVENPGGDFLLISILPEPDAHAIALMKAPEHRSLMEAFSRVAAEWLTDGSIVA